MKRIYLDVHDDFPVLQLHLALRQIGCRIRYRDGVLIAEQPQRRRNRAADLVPFPGPRPMACSTQQPGPELA